MNEEHNVTPPAPEASLPDYREEPPASSPPEQPGIPRIGKYEVDSEIGHGERVKVFKAHDRQTGRHVTLKLLMDLTDAAFVERFRHEVALAANVASSAFAAVYEAGEHVGFTFAAMQRAGDDHMGRILKRKPFLSLLQKMSIMWEVAEGAHAAHLAGLAHVGIRPSAIALSDRHHALIQDFGFVRLSPEDAGEATAYAAPEELEGLPPDRLCDIFAFGTLYYELLTGSRPFLSADNGHVGVPDCPQALERLVLRTLEKQRVLRYQSFEEIQEDAEPILRELRRARAPELLAEARALVDAGDFDRAQSAVREALEWDPGNSRAERFRVEIRGLLKRQTAKPRIEALLRAAEEACAAGNHEGAVAIVDSASELVVPDPEVATRMESIQRRIEGSREAVRLAAEARQLMEQGSLVEAWAAASQALAADPACRVAADLLVEIDAVSRRREQEAQVERGLAQAKSLLLLESFDAAIAGLTSLRAECPGYPIIDQWLDRVHAQQAAERAARVEIQRRGVSSLLSSGRFDQAMEALEILVEQYPEADVSDLTRQAREAKEREAAVTQALEEVEWLLGQSRPDLAVQFMREQAELLDADPKFAARLAEIEATLPEWEGRRAIEVCLSQVAALEQRQQWSVALTVLEEALLVNPAAGELLAAAERIRGRLFEQERRRRLGRRLEAIGHKIAAQDWPQALATIEAARAEFPGESEFDLFERAAHAGLLRAKAENIASDVRQCLADGETDRAGQILRDGLEALPGEPVLTALLEEVEADKRFRSEWRTAQVLFGRRQFEEAEAILVPLAAEARPEVQALLELVREARAATAEEEIHQRGDDKALKLIQEMQFGGEAANVLRSLSSLFPGDPTLERHIASAERSGERDRPAGEPAPVSAVETAAKPEEPAGLGAAGPAAARPVTIRSMIARQRSFWAALALCGVLSVLSAGVLWNRSRGKAPLKASAAVQVPKQDAPVQVPAGPAPAQAVSSAAVPASKAREPIESRKTPAPKPLRTSKASAFDVAALARQTQAGLQSAPLPAPPIGITGGPRTEPAGILSELMRPGRSVPPPGSPATAVSMPQSGSAAGNWRPATPTSQPAPEMPMLARRSGIHGVVDLEAAIDKLGVVRDVRVVNGNPVLAVAARQAVLSWRYQPATRDGQPIESKLAVQVVFKARE